MREVYHFFERKTLTNFLLTRRVLLAGGPFGKLNYSYEEIDLDCFFELLRRFGWSQHLFLLPLFPAANARIWRKLDDQLI